MLVRFETELLPMRSRLTKASCGKDDTQREEKAGSTLVVVRARASERNVAERDVKGRAGFRSMQR